MESAFHTYVLYLLIFGIVATQISVAYLYKR